MRELLIDAAAELFSFLVFTLLGGALALAGVAWENFGISSLLTGETVLGVWFVLVGSLALFVGIYLIGYRELPKRYRAVRRRLAG
ncbi:MAG: hypothetical protein U5J98_09820 [Halobacteriales archaeon]|nr:hypothetical protein [Halobacteriales archaeon]